MLSKSNLFSFSNFLQMQTGPSVYTTNKPVLAEILLDKLSFTDALHPFIYFLFMANAASRTLTQRKRFHALQVLSGSRDKFSCNFLF